MVNLWHKPKGLNSELRFIPTERKINLGRWQYQNTEKYKCIWELILEGKKAQGRKGRPHGTFLPIIAAQISPLPNSKYLFCLYNGSLRDQLGYQGTSILWTVYSFLFPSTAPAPSSHFLSQFLCWNKFHFSSHVFSKDIKRTRVSLPPFLSYFS